MFLPNKFSNFELTGELNLLATIHKELLNKNVHIIDLTLSNPTKAGIKYPQKEISLAITNPQIFQYEPAPKGLYIARESIARYYFEKGFNVSPEDIFLVSGTSEGYSYILKLLCNPGDKILVPAPSYPLLDFIATLENVEIENFELKLSSENEWRLELENISEKLDEKTKAILFVQPNNPTGTILNPMEAKILLEFCERHHVNLIIDEVFREFIFDHSKSVPLLFSDNIPVFVLNGISKTLGLPQLKLGWIIALFPNKYKTQMNEALEIICDTYLSVNTPVQVGLERLFYLKEEIVSNITQRITKNLEYAIIRLKNSPILKLYKPEGGWYIVIRYNIDIGSEKLAVELLKNTGVYVHPGIMFNFPEDRYLVISLLPLSSEFIEGLEKIIKFLETLERK